MLLIGRLDDESLDLCPVLYLRRGDGEELPELRDAAWPVEVVQHRTVRVRR
jgi:hypothetical protein